MDHTVGNEHKQIIGFYTVFSKATREMFNTCYSKIYRRYRLFDMEMPVTHYVDNPEDVQKAIGSEPAIIPSLSDGARCDLCAEFPSSFNRKLASAGRNFTNSGHFLQLWTHFWWNLAQFQEQGLHGLFTESNHGV